MKYLSLFSGIGGFELGIQNSDVEMECIGFSEVDKNAKSIYKRWFPNHRDLGDATKIRPEDLPNFDLLVAGFPCQPFSLAGTRGGLDDTRGTLFFEIARICQEKKPQYLLLENVMGLLSNERGRTFQKFVRILTEMGYHVQWEVRNSKNYGVPQNRERVFIKGYLGERGRSEVLCFGGDQRKTSKKQIKISPLIIKRKCDVDIKKLKKTLRDSRKESGLITQEIADYFGLLKTHVDHWFKNDNSFVIPNAEFWYPLKKLIGIKNNDFDAFVTEFEVINDMRDNLSFDTPTNSYSKEVPGINVVVPGKQAARVMSIDGSSAMLCGNAGGLGGNTGLYAIPKVVGNYSEKNHGGANVHDPKGISPTLTATNYKHPITIRESDCNNFDDYDFRRLTPIETERLQAFPDDWTKYGVDGEKISDTQRYRCIGNAVTTSVITHIINEMFSSNS